MSIFRNMKAILTSIRRTFFTSALALLVCAACSPREEGLILRYDFSKSEGTVLKDVSGNGFDAALKGSATILKGNEGACLDLGNEEGYVDMGSGIGEALKACESFSISVKFLVSSEASLKGYGYFLWAFSTLEANGATDGRYHAFRLNTQQAENSVGGYTGESFMVVNEPAAQGSWQHAVYVQDGTVGKLYMNGTVVAQNDQMYTMAETFPEEAPTFNWMGKAPFRGDKYLAGTMISDVRIYDRALSEEEIEKL